VRRGGRRRGRRRRRKRPIVKVKHCKVIFVVQLVKSQC